MCQHLPACPAGHAPDGTAARVVADHRGPGWSLLCNGAVLFEDGSHCSPVAGHRAVVARRGLCGQGT
jgi:hypothetical protein